MRLVTLNGPIGSGKSPVVREITKRNPDTKVIPVSFQDSLIAGTRAMLGVPASLDYGIFKTTVYSGLTGRQWMIHFDSMARQKDEYFFAKIMLENMRRATDTRNIRTLFMADSNGFSHELEYMRSREDVDILACSLEPQGTVGRGEQYPGDSRFNLAHMCTLVTQDSYEMVTKLQAALQRRGWV